MHISYWWNMLSCPKIILVWSEIVKCLSSNKTKTMYTVCIPHFFLNPHNLHAGIQKILSISTCLTIVFILILFDLWDELRNLTKQNTPYPNRQTILKSKLQKHLSFSCYSSFLKAFPAGANNIGRGSFKGGTVQCCCVIVAQNNNGPICSAFNMIGESLTVFIYSFIYDSATFPCEGQH